MSVETLQRPSPIVTAEQPSAPPRLDLFYGNLFQREKSDSPDLSRVSMARRMRNAFADLGTSDAVLSLGSGPQSVERQYLSAFGPMPLRMVTLDFAKIESARLLAKRKNISHIRASGESLPFPDGSFSGVTSNMALDFMKDQAIEELARVTRRGGHLMINLHHPDMVKDCDNQFKRGEITKDVYEQWKYLKDNKRLYENEEEIRQKFERFGFQAVRVSLAIDDKIPWHVDKWWEVDLIKPKS